MQVAKTAVILAFCAVAALGQKTDWNKYEYSEDGFAIFSPFKPTLEKTLVDSDAGKMEMHNYSVDVGLLWNLGVSVNDVRRFGDLPSRGLLQAAKDGSVAEVKGTLVSEKEVSLEGAPGIEYEISTTAYHSLVRCYYVNGRTITMVSTAKTGFPFFTHTDRFFDSLRFIPAWQEYEYAYDGFAISAPTKPSMQNKSMDTQLGSAQSHIYSIDFDGDSGTMISVTAYGRGHRIPPDAFEPIKNAMLQSAKAKLLSESNISLDSNPGIEFEMGSETYRARARCYIVENKLVVIISFAGQGKPLPPDTTRILGSLRLLKAQK